LDRGADGKSLHRGRHLSYQRGRRNTHPKTSLIKIEGVDDTAAAKYVRGILVLTFEKWPLTYETAFTLASGLRMSTGLKRRSAAPRSV